MACIRENRATRGRKKSLADAEFMYAEALKHSTPLKRQMRLLIGYGDWEKTLNTFLGVKRKLCNTLLEEKKNAVKEFTDLHYDKQYEMAITFSESYAVNLIKKKNKMNIVIKELMSLKSYLNDEIPILKDELRWLNKEEELDWEYEGSFHKILDYVDDSIYRVTCERNELNFTLRDRRDEIDMYLRNRMYFFKEVDNYKKNYLNDIHELEEDTVERTMWAFKDISRLWKKINILKVTIPHFIKYHKDRVRVRAVTLLEMVQYATYVKTKFRDRPVRKSKTDLFTLLNAVQSLELTVWQKTAVIDRIEYLLNVKGLGLTFTEILDSIKHLINKNFDLYYHVIWIRKEVNELIQDLQSMKKLRLDTQKELRRFEVTDMETIAQLETDRKVMRWEIDRVCKKLDMYNRLPLIFYGYYKQLFQMIGLTKQVHPFYKELVVFNLSARNKKKEVIKTQLGDKMKKILGKRFKKYLDKTLKKEVNKTIKEKYSKRIQKKTMKKWKAKIRKCLKNKLRDKFGSKATKPIIEKLLRKELRKDNSKRIKEEIKKEVKDKIYNKLSVKLEPKLERQLKKKFRKKVKRVIRKQMKRPPLSTDGFVNRLNDIFDNYRCLIENAKEKAAEVRKLKKKEKAEKRKLKAEMMKKMKKNKKRPKTVQTQSVVTKQSATGQPPVLPATPGKKPSIKPILKAPPSTPTTADSRGQDKTEEEQKSSKELEKKKKLKAYKKKFIRLVQRKLDLHVKKSKKHRKHKRKHSRMSKKDKNDKKEHDKKHKKKHDKKKHHDKKDKHGKKKKHGKKRKHHSEKSDKEDDGTKKVRFTLEGKIKKPGKDKHGKHRKHGKKGKKKRQIKKHGKKQGEKKKVPQMDPERKVPPNKEMETIVDHIIDIYVHGDRRLKDPYNVKESFMDPATFKHYAAALESQLEMLLIKVYYKEHYESKLYRKIPVYVFRRNPLVIWHDKPKHLKILERAFLQYFESDIPLKYPCFWCVHDAFTKDRKAVKERLFTLSDARKYVVRNVRSPKFQDIWHDLKDCPLPEARELRDRVKKTTEAHEAAKRGE